MSRSVQPYLSASDLGLTLPDGRRLFGDLDLSFGRERTGLVGPNGAGKSLLLDVLVGTRPPSVGSVVRHGTVAYVRQGGGHSAAPPDETVADRLGVRARLEALARVLEGGTDPVDYALVGSEGWDLPERLRLHLGRFGLGDLPLDRPIGEVSGGEATRTALAGATLGDPDLLVLDEPTNDLDATSRHALYGALDAWDGGLLVVSHDRALLRGMDRIVELGPSGVREYGGGYDTYRAIRDREIAGAERALAEAEASRRRARVEARRVRERQDRRSARGKRARAEGGVPKVLLNAQRNRSQASTGRLGQVMDTVEAAAAERVSEARARVEEMAPLRMDVPRSDLPSGKDVLVLESVSYRPPGGTSRLLDGVDLVIRGPERVAVVGPNGCGKSTLLSIVSGARAPTEGTVRVDRTGLAYLDQSVRLLRQGESVLSSFRRLHPTCDEERARHVLARYLFAGNAALASVDRLSGGERMRAGLACVLGGATAPTLLVLDEPTNHLDFRSLDTVERAVAAFDGALLVASHDPDFLAAVGVERELVLGGPSSSPAR